MDKPERVRQCRVCDVVAVPSFHVFKGSTSMTMEFDVIIMDEKACDKFRDAAKGWGFWGLWVAKDIQYDFAELAFEKIRAALFDDGKNGMVFTDNIRTQERDAKDVWNAYEVVVWLQGSADEGFSQTGNDSIPFFGGAYREAGFGENGTRKQSGGDGKETDEAAFDACCDGVEDGAYEWDRCTCQRCKYAV